MDTQAKDKQLQAHTLTKVSRTPEATVWHMAEPGTRNMSVVLVFLRNPEKRILITGDICIGPFNGVVSDLGYGEVWFAGRASDEHLASKFFRKDYYREYGKAWITDSLNECRKELDEVREELELANLRADHDAAVHDRELRIDLQRRRGTLQGRITVLEVALDLQHRYEDHDAFSELYREVTGKSSTDGEGLGYDPAAMAWLCAIQKRFSELYHELALAEEKQGVG